MTREITAGELTTKSGPGATQPIPIHDGITVTSQPARESPSFGNDFWGSILHVEITAYTFLL